MQWNVFKALALAGGPEASLPPSGQAYRQGSPEIRGGKKFRFVHDALHSKPAGGPQTELHADSTGERAVTAWLAGVCPAGRTVFILLVARPTALDSAVVKSSDSRSNSSGRSSSSDMR